MMRSVVMCLGIIGFALAALVVIQGCNESSPTAPQQNDVEPEGGDERPAPPYPGTVTIEIMNMHAAGLEVSISGDGQVLASKTLDMFEVWNYSRACTDGTEFGINWIGTSGAGYRSAVCGYKSRHEIR